MTRQTPELWNAEAAAFDQAADHGLSDPGVRAAWRALLLPLIGEPPRDVADLGCGTGTLSLLLAEGGHHVHGVDFSAEMLRLAHEKADSMGSPPRFTHGDVAEPPLPVASFDVVLSRHVLWALPDPAAVLANWARLLRAGGALVLVEGSWSTGVGLTADDCRILVQGLGGEVQLCVLDDPALWGRPVIDERYLVVSHPTLIAHD